MSAAIQNQGPTSNKVFNAYEELQDLIRRETGVVCSVLVTPKVVSIRTKNYSDFILARKVIRGRVSVEIIWDEK